MSIERSDKTTHRLLWPTLCVFLVFRLTICDRGALSMWDEHRYLRVIDTLQELRALDFRGGAHSLLVLGLARPGIFLLWLFPAIAHSLAAGSSGLDLLSPVLLRIGVIFNVLVSIIQLLLFHRIGSVIVRSERLALAATASFAMMTSSNLYLRHMLPFDGSLTIYLGALLLALGRPQSAWAAAICGALSLVGFTVYPGFYFFPVVLFLLYLRRAVATGRPAPLYSYVASGLTLLVATEIVFTLSRHSYVSVLFGLSKTVTQGSFSEGFSFVPKYLLQVEGPFGILLLCGSLWVLAGALCDRRRLAAMSEPDLLFLAAIGGIILHAASSSLLHHMVFYGRIVRMYLPFLIWAVFGEVSRAKRLVTAAAAILICASAASFARSMPVFAALAYPRDLLYRLGIESDAYNPEMRTAEISRCVPVTREVHTYEAAPRDTSLHPGAFLVNFCDFGVFDAPLAEVAPLPPPAGFTRVYSGAHFQTFPAYLFEGWSVGDRRAFAANGRRVEIWLASE